MAQWVSDDWCKQAMFNLKLPMKKRFESVMECIDIINSEISSSYQLRAKHLYHDRDEVTVFLTKS